MSQGLAPAVMNAIQPRETRLHTDPGFWSEAVAKGRDSLAALSAKDLGRPVVDHRTSWVRQAVFGTFSTFVKTYDYPTWRDRLRGFRRTTAAAPSRAAREAEALAWMAAEGLPAPRCLAVLEARGRTGFLRRCVLVTETHPGETLDRLLPGLPDAQRDELLVALERFVEDLHARGFRDRNLDLRNLLAHRSEAGWELAKIDSPRHRLVPPGAACDPLAQRDWQRLARSIDAVLPPARRDTGRKPS